MQCTRIVKLNHTHAWFEGIRLTNIIGPLYHSTTKKRIIKQIMCLWIAKSITSLKTPEYPCTCWKIRCLYEIDTYWLSIQEHSKKETRTKKENISVCYKPVQFYWTTTNSHKPNTTNLRSSYNNKLLTCIYFEFHSLNQRLSERIKQRFVNGLNWPEIQ